MGTKINLNKCASMHLPCQVDWCSSRIIFLHNQLLNLVLAERASALVELTRVQTFHNVRQVSFVHVYEQALAP